MDRDILDTAAEQAVGQVAASRAVRSLELAASAVLVTGLITFTAMFVLGLVSFIALVNNQENLVGLNVFLSSARSRPV